MYVALVKTICFIQLGLLRELSLVFLWKSAMTEQVFGPVEAF